MSINIAVVSGEVRKVFGPRDVGEEGLRNLGISLTFKSGSKDKNILVNVYGDDADKLELEEGQKIVVQGRLHETNWQDKETKEWNNRHEVVASFVEILGDEESGGLDD